MAGQSYRVTSTRTLVRAPGARTSAYRPTTIIGEFDPARSVGEETADGATQIRYVGDYIYIPVFGAFRRTHPGALPTSRSWVKLHVPPRSSMVDVDQRGRVRQLDTVESVEATVSKVRMTFGDFGIRVSVSALPADETVSP
jgi:hypothetical protein